jgi:hypothetical protein
MINNEQYVTYAGLYTRHYVVGFELYANINA